ncbi:MAG: ATP-binding cassette domain-containing protein [Defluviitaleaceae bacterium]|nr:ATP-binding cassette domain-containing protein [Defluviitaleaceae bacterium]
MIEVKDLKVHFPIRKGFFRRVVGHVKAVDGINLNIEAGKTYGLVGESGSGKTTTGRSIIGLDHVTSGEILFEGQKLDLRKKASRDVQMIFQNPFSSLNPKRQVLDIVAEPLRNFEQLTPAQELERVQELMSIVGLSPESIYKYPHEFSGGQRQRIGIARAIALKPKLIIADEPVSALDVSVQAQVLNFMKEIQKELGLTYLFISHDLSVVRYMCDHIGIMYKGRFVESGTADDIFENPQHIYTKRLLGAIPSTDPRKRDELMANRRKVNAEFEALSKQYFDETGLAYPLKKISSTHAVAMLGEVK